MRFAAIICNLARAAARCGPGAVMGSKNLKAIAVRGDRGIHVADKTAFKQAVDKAVQAILSDPLYDSAKTYGTLAITGMAQALGFLPTRNFQQSTFGGADKLAVKSSWSDMALNTRGVTIAQWHAAGYTISLMDPMLQLVEKALNTKASQPSAQNAGMTISMLFYTQIRFATNWDWTRSPREMSLRGLWNAVKRVF